VRGCVASAAEVLIRNLIRKITKNFAFLETYSGIPNFRKVLINQLLKDYPYVRWGIRSYVRPVGKEPNVILLVTWSRFDTVDPPHV